MQLRKSKINIDTKLEAIELFKQGVDIREISKQLNFGVATIKYWICKGQEGLLSTNLYKPYHKISKVDKLKAIERITSGESYEEISKLYNVHPQTIKYWMKKKITNKNKNKSSETSIHSISSSKCSSNQQVEIKTEATVEETNQPTTCNNISEMIDNVKTNVEIKQKEKSKSKKSKKLNMVETQINCLIKMIETTNETQLSILKNISNMLIDED